MRSLIFEQHHGLEFLNRQKMKPEDNGVRSSRAVAQTYILNGDKILIK